MIDKKRMGRDIGIWAITIAAAWSLLLACIVAGKFAYIWAITR